MSEQQQSTQTTTRRGRRAAVESNKPPAGSGVDEEGNIKLAYTEDLAKIIKDEADLIIRLRKEREGINAEITAAGKRLKAKGISKRAIENGIKRLELNQAERDGMDLEQVIVYRSLGVMQQIDMPLH